jgi:hypothetical protein
MNDLANSIAVLGKPYSVTKSRLGAITKVYDEKFICDLPALKELFQSIGEKLGEIQSIKPPQFSFLISFSDKTHQDGVTSDLQGLTSIPIGKQTERVVMRWGVQHLIDGAENELSVTVRISNPINPLVFLQAALSKSPNDIDNLEFELGSTCVTVDGSGQRYADEVFLRVQNWIRARNKPHAFVDTHETYLKHEWAIDQFNVTLFPLLCVVALSLYSLKFELKDQIMAGPIIVVLFFTIQVFTRQLNSKMGEWARRAKMLSLFQITNGDADALTKISAKAKNSFLKLIVSAIFSFLLNIFAGIVCWRLTGA